MTIEKLISTARQAKLLMLDDKVNTIKVYPDGSDMPKVFHVEKRGRWIKEKNRRNRWHCSKCKYVIGVMKMDANYCPNCGAKMEKDDERFYRQTGGNKSHR